MDHEFPAKDWVGKQVTLMVRATGPKGKASDWSNAVALAVGVPLATPANLTSRFRSKRCAVNLAGFVVGRRRYRIFRGAGDAMPQRLAESDKPEYVDTAVDFGSPYRYFVQALVGEQRQSEISAIVGVTPTDTFPPAVPVGLMAVAGVNSIELAWQPQYRRGFGGVSSLPLGRRQRAGENRRAGGCAEFQRPHGGDWQEVQLHDHLDRSHRE